MAFLITGILFIAGMLWKKSKCIYFLQFWWMWLLMSFCEDYYRSDYQNYAKKFLRSGTERFAITDSEFGYTILNKILYNTGIDFNTANAVMVLITLLIIAYSIPKFTKYITIPSSLYMIYPLFMNGIQIRNAIVSAIIIFGFQYLLKPGRIATIKFILCMAIAVTFHSAAIVYLLLILVKYLDENKIRRITIATGVSITLIISILEPILALLFGEKRFAAKIYIKNTIGEAFMMAFWQISFLVILLIFRNRRLKRERKYSEIRNIMENTLIKVNILMVIITPLYYADFTIERLFQNLLVIGYAYFAMIIEEYNESKKSAYMHIDSLLFLSWFVVTTIILEVWYADAWNRIILSYMNQNAFINNMEQNFPIVLIVLVIGLGLAIFDINNTWIRFKRVRVRIKR